LLPYYINLKKKFIMKKISAILFTAILVMAFVACNGAKKTEAPAENPVKNDTVVQVAPEPAAPQLSPAEMLKDFQTYVKTYGEAYNNIAKDPKKFIELSGQSQKRVADMEQIKSQLNATQMQAYQKALDLVIKINKGGK